MIAPIDALDRNILSELQQNSSQTLDELAQKLGSSKTPIWNRVKKLRASGVIKSESAILNPELLGFDACFFVLIRTSEHDQQWQEKFLHSVRSRPEVMEAHRLAGDIDYILKVRVKNPKAYDEFYQALIKEVKIFNVTALLSMEEVKNTHKLPI